MGLGKWAARKGSIGQTAQWVAQAFWGAINNQILDLEKLSSADGKSGEARKIIVYALNARFASDMRHPDYQKILDQYDNVFGPGLCGFTIAILNVEAEFMENTEANQNMFREVIEEELRKANVGEILL
jgi:hypothetical protein